MSKRKNPQAITVSIAEGTIPNPGEIVFSGEDMESVALTFHHPMGEIDLTITDDTAFVADLYKRVMEIHGAHGSKPLPFQLQICV
jgi:hypothetical protein